MGIKLWIALIGVFAGFVLLVPGMGYVAFYLSPRDPDVIQRAAEFEAVMADVEIPNRHPEATGTVHRVAEWAGGRFGEAPLLAQRVREGHLPPVSQRLPENPLVIVPPQQHGPYGGTWARFATGPRDVGIVEARFAYEGLVRWDAMAQKVIPNLAVRWEIADGGRSFTFYLRRGVKWSDGHPFTVDDLIFWYEDVLQNEEITPVVPRDFKRGGQVMGLQKVDDYTVRFTFLEPNGLFIVKLASGRGYEMLRYPAHYMKQFHPQYASLEKLEAMSEAAGFDLWRQLFADMHDWRNPDIPRLWPWIVVAPPPARPAVLERNPYYWKVDPAGNQLPYIDRMTFEILMRRPSISRRSTGRWVCRGGTFSFRIIRCLWKGERRAIIGLCIGLMDLRGQIFWR